jgi:predicted ArsR family transcriptional regulator
VERDMNQVRKILLALGAGADTSKEIACVIGTKRGAISVALCRLADAGVIERMGVANEGRPGRPYVRWRVRRPPPARAVAGLRPDRSRLAR